MAGCPLNISIASNPGANFIDCNKKLDIAHDIIDVLNGKWKMETIVALLQHSKRRFNELQKDIPGVSAKVLAGVLKDLEINHIITRSIISIVPATAEYQLTDYGKSMQQPITEFVKLGMAHRKEVIGK